MAISVMVSSWRPMFSSLPQSQSKPSNPIFNGFVGSQTENKRNVVVCSSRPQKKGTKHHMNTRPKKSQQWEINRRPTVYAPLPPLPPDWSLDPNQSKVPSFSIAEKQTVSRTS